MELLESTTLRRSSGSALETPLEPFAKAASPSKRNPEQHRGESHGTMERHDDLPPAPPLGVPAATPLCIHRDGRPHGP